MSAPADWNIPSNIVLSPSIVFAHFDGSAAAGSFVPTLQILSDSGHVVAEIPQDVTVAAGSSCEATWAPFLETDTAASSSSGGFSGGSVGAISQVGSPTFANLQSTGITQTTTITLPSSLQANDLLLIFLGAFDNTQPLTVTAIPSGWAKIYLFNLPVFGNPAFSQSTPRAAYYKISDGTESGKLVSFTVTATASSNIAVTLFAVAYRGVGSTNLGSYFFKSYILPINASTWSIDAPAITVSRPGSQVLQVLYDVKRSTSITHPADVTLLESHTGAENDVTMALAGKTADTAAADTWTGTIVSPAPANTSYFEMCQMVLNPNLAPSS